MGEDGGGRAQPGGGGASDHCVTSSEGPAPAPSRRHTDQPTPLPQSHRPTKCHLSIQLQEQRDNKHQEPLHTFPLSPSLPLSHSLFFFSLPLLSIHLFHSTSFSFPLYLYPSLTLPLAPSLNSLALSPYGFLLSSLSLSLSHSSLAPSLNNLALTPYSFLFSSLSLSLSHSSSLSPSLSHSSSLSLSISISLSLCTFIPLPLSSAPLSQGPALCPQLSSRAEQPRSSRKQRNDWRNSVSCLT